MAAALVVLFGVGFFGLVSLVVGWFENVEGVAGPVTDLGYGALVGIILTAGLGQQLRAPERKIAGLQQAALVAPAFLIGSAIAADTQNLAPALIVAASVGVMLALHPARAEFLRLRPRAFSPALLAITVLGAIPLIAYGLRMGAQARALSGPPHHVQRLSTMAALAVGIVLVGLLAALKTRGWTIPAWSAGAAAVVFGVASAAFPADPGAVGRSWGGLAIVGGATFMVVAEFERRKERNGYGPRRRATASISTSRSAASAAPTVARAGNGSEKYSR